MPHKIKLAPEHFTGIRPQSRSDMRSLVSLCLSALGAVAAVFALWMLQQHWQQVRELTWSSANGTIEDIRSVPTSEVDSQFGGAMLYQVQVLVRFPFGSSSAERWVTVRHAPESLSQLQGQMQRWKGASCIVRWNPSNPDQIDAEVS